MKVIFAVSVTVLLFAGPRICSGTVTASCDQTAAQRVSCPASTFSECVTLGCWWCSGSVVPKCTEGAACRRTIAMDGWGGAPGTTPTAELCRKEYGASWCENAPHTKCRMEYVPDDTLTCARPVGEYVTCPAGTVSECLAAGCWVCQHSTTLYCVQGLVCSKRKADRINCWPDADTATPNADDCRNKYGCSWCDKNPKCVKEYAPFTPGYDQCDSTKSERDSCPSTSPKPITCVDNGCWWCGDGGINPRCIYGKICTKNGKVNCWPANNPDAPNPKDCRRKYGCSWCPDDNGCFTEPNECEREFFDRENCFEAGDEEVKTVCLNNGCFWCSDRTPKCTKGKACQSYPKEDCWPSTDSRPQTPGRCRKRYKCSWCEEEGQPSCVRPQPLCDHKDVLNCYPWIDPDITVEECIGTEGNPTGCVYCPVPSSREFKCTLAMCPDGHERRYKQNSCCQQPNAGASIEVDRMLATNIQRIVGGDEAENGQWPWQGHFQIMLNATAAAACGAVLLDNQHAVTAAHCWERIANSLSVRLILGTHDLTSTNGPNVILIDDPTVIPHPDYASTGSNDDLALITFPSITFNSRVQPVALPYGEIVPVGSRCFATGWGATSYRGPTTTKLMEVGVDVLPFSTCTEAYGNSVSATSNLCVGYKFGGRDACQGDSGGPLVCQRCKSCTWYLAGTVAVGIDCGIFNLPGIYTKMSHYEDWLMSDNGVNDPGESHNCNGFY